MRAAVASWLKKLTRFRRRRKRDAAMVSLAELGTLSEEEHGFLQELVQRSNPFPGDLIEIGTLFGHTTQRLASWKAPQKRVVTVDRFSWNPWGLTDGDHERLAGNNLFYLTGHGHVELVKADKNDFYRDRDFAVPPALVFLDAVHKYDETRKDIVWARRVGARVICGHDYGPAFPGVIQAVQEFGGPEKVVGTVWVLPVAA
jgi:hypothetical protein